MSVSTQDYAMLSSLVYDELRDDKPYSNGTSAYKVIMTSSTASGYRGALFKNVETGELVVANAGTDPHSSADIANDVEMNAGFLPAQYDDASSFMLSTMDYAQAQGIDSVTTTGHSLGGSLAQLLAMTFGIHAETFNPYGTYGMALDAGLDPEAAKELIVNNREALDLISHSSMQVGENREYMSESDLVATNHLLFSTPIIDPGAAYEYGKQVTLAHSISNFWNAEENRPSDLFEHNCWPAVQSLHHLVFEYVRGIPKALSMAGTRFARSMESGESFWGSFFDSVAFLRARRDLCGTFNTFSRYPQRTDPFTLDLDGDGLETVGTNASNPVMFDINASGVKQAVGWVLPDDGFLALDSNGNGTIDSGAELFGDATVLPDGGKAQDGFSAVASLDTNADGIVDAQDAAWTQLRVWQDLNQDGVSQSKELKGMADAGIASISVNKTEHETVLDNGNALADLGVFTRTDGTEGATGTVGQLADINLSVDTFQSQFTDSIPVSDQAAELPDLQGSGQVRDLRQAASMDTDAGRALASILAQYNAATTRDAQSALLDDVIKAWSNTSTMATTFTGAYAGHGLTVDMRPFDPGEVEYAHWANMLTVMEHFNGRTFQPIPGGTGAVTLTLWHTPRDLLQKSYDALKQEVYDGLLLKTLLKPYMDSIQLRISDAGTVDFDFAGTDELFQARYAQAPAEAVRDLLDVQRLNGPNLTSAGWNGYEQLRGWIHDAATNPDHDAATRTQLLSDIQAGMAWFGYAGLATDGTGGSGNDVVIGGADGAVLTGVAGDDLVLGGTGVDTLMGGTGNDTLVGGAGNDTYVVNLGDGNDTIIETHGDGGTDDLRFGAGISMGDLLISRNGNAAVFGIGNGEDSVSIANWFNSFSDAAHRLDRVSFADGSSFDLSHLQLGTDTADTLVGAVDGAATPDVLAGDDGDDVLTGNDGNDLLNGGAGIDQMVGGAGDDLYIVDAAGDVVIENAVEGTDTEAARVSTTLAGNVENLILVGSTDLAGTGNALGNTLAGNSGDNILHGMAGRDVLVGKDGNDVLDGGTGSDQMIGGEGDDAYLVDDSGDTIIEWDNEGTDTVRSGIDRMLSDHVENLILTGTAINGTGNAGFNVLIGNALDNTLRGMAGNDTLDGGAGTNRLYGGAGNDTYLVDDAGDLVLENLGEGIDTVRSSTDYTLNDHVENLELIGSAALTGTGNALDNMISGNDAANVLQGGEGDDRIDGAGGNDTLRGGAGHDVLDGGTGSDVYLFNLGDGQDTIMNNDSDAGRVDTLQFGEGIQPAGVTARRTGIDLVLWIVGTTDEVVVRNYFMADAEGSFRLDAIHFADGTAWDVAQVKALVQVPTSYSDNLYAYATGDTLNGLAGNDTIRGAAGNDVLVGGAGNDTLNGGPGSDIYLFNAGDGHDTINNYDDDSGRVDTLQFGEGIAPVDVTARRTGDDLILTLAGTTDTIQVTDYFWEDAKGSYQLDDIHFADGTTWDIPQVKALVQMPTDGADDLYGYATDDTLSGSAGNDTIRGAAGNDVLAGGTGNDILDGGAGSDVYVFNAGDGQDIIHNHDTSRGRFDVLAFGAGIDPAKVMARRANGHLTLAVAGTDDQITINNYFTGDTPEDYQVDEIRFADADNTVWKTADIKLKVLEPTPGADILQGYATDDTLRGGAGDDTLFGNVGDDVLAGGTGNDTLNGGTGSNQYLFARNDGQDIIKDAYEGPVAIHLSGLPRQSLVFRRSGNDLAVTFQDSQDDTLALDAFFVGDAPRTSLQVNFADGSQWTIDPSQMATLTLQGTAGNDRIEAYSSDDVVNALGGDDTVFSGAGQDTLDGGPGNDHLVAGAGDDQVVGGDGDDRLEGGTGNDGLHGGNGADTLLGQAGADTLIGGTGNDLIDGGAGADSMAGGAGDDTYVVDNVQDTVVENASEGVDTILSSVSYTAPAQVENLTLTGYASAATGNALDNQLTGNAVSNQLDGMDGDDVLLGMGGDDVLVGGNGNDTLTAGEGADTLVGGAGDDTLHGGDGQDTLTGGDGNDLLDGGADADAMVGGAGDDTYLVDTRAFVFGNPADVITEQAGEGFDTVMTSTDYTLTDNVEKLVLVEGNWAPDGTGNASDNQLVGNNRDNRLDGRAGADTMTGGTGNDTYVVDNTGDRIIETIGQGADTVESSISYTLGTTLENLTLSGSANLDGTGNAADNQLTGNTGNNRLDGAGGADTFSGGQGDDTYIVDSATDRVVEQAGAGNDTIERRFETNVALADNVENLVLATGVTTGAGNALDNALTGNAAANTLIGLAGNDTLRALAGDDVVFGGGGSDVLAGDDGDDYLDGGSGADTLTGGAGNDTYVVDDANDRVIEQAAGGNDTVQATGSATLANNVENLFLLADDGNVEGTGNDLSNYLGGSGADNVLQGLAGNDTLDAGTGNNTLVGGAGNDAYIIDTQAQANVIDNADGGFDGIFFANTVTRDQLDFAREGDDLLIFVDHAATPAVRVTNHFLGGDAAIDYVQPSGGYYLTTAQINQIVAAAQTGGVYDQVITGTNAAEQLVGSTGKDLVKGLAGNDQLFGMAGDDDLQGGDGDDYLSGGDGSGTGSGDDHLTGGAGADTLVGEDGSNTLAGGAGNDTYIYGGGQDTLDNTGGGTDGLFFNNGITVDDLGLTRDGDDLLITVRGDATQTVRVTGHFLGGDAAIDFIQPASGTLLDTAAINALVNDGNAGGGTTTPPADDGTTYDTTVEGTDAADQLLGTAGTDLIHGGAGNDSLFGFGGNDELVAGEGDDYLSGGNGSFNGSGDDVLIGGAGADTLVGEDGADGLMGGAGNDQYLWQAGSGMDVIDNTGGGTDWLFFNGVDPGRLGWHRDGDDLVVLVDEDPTEGVRVLDHFQGPDTAIDYVQPGSGYAMDAAQIDILRTPLPATAGTTTDPQLARLIQSMATFHPGAAATLDLTGANDPLGATSSSTALAATQTDPLSTAQAQAFG